MFKRGKASKLSIISGDSDGAGAKRGRDGAASLVAAKAAEQSGDDRFSLSKFQLDERFRRSNRVSGAAAAAAAAAAKVMSSEEEEDDDDGGSDDDHDDDDDNDDDDDGNSDDNSNNGDDDDDDDDDDDADDGNYDIANDDSDGVHVSNGAGTTDDAGVTAAASISKKIAKKLKPMSPEELALFMKVFVRVWRFRAQASRRPSPPGLLRCLTRLGRSKSSEAWCISAASLPT